MQRDHRELLLEYGYPEELISGWSAEDCEAEWDQFCSKVISGIKNIPRKLGGQAGDTLN